MKLLLRVVVALTLLWFSSANADGTKGSSSGKVVKTNSGPIRGTRMRTDGGRDVDAFLAIPYAVAPTGRRRFQPPVARVPWKRTLNATGDGEPCVQYNSTSRTVFGAEDCLVLNVYTSQLPAGNNNKNNNSDAAGNGTATAPVVVFIHGGEFQVGSARSTLYGPGYLLDNDLVLVTVQYRLDALGFLSTGDDSSPGNYGLLDQALALEWVQDNVGAFGGNRSKVTIVGQSAGAASVILHIVSPVSAGLFDGAVAMSGSPLCPWAMEDRPLEMAARLAADLDCPTEATETEEMVACLRNVSAERLIATVHNASGAARRKGFLRFLPTVDENFLPAHPEEILANPQHVHSVPVMAGVVVGEGESLVPQRLLPPNSTRAVLEAAIRKALTRVTGGGNWSSDAARLVRKRYLSSVNVSDAGQVRRALVRVVTDGEFDVCHYQTVRRLIGAGLPVYAYSYDYVISAADMTDHSRGHSADLFTVFSPSPFGRGDNGSAGVRFNDNDRRMASTMTSLITDFANTGEPSVQLQPAWERSTSRANITVYHLSQISSARTFYPLGDATYRFWRVDVAEAKRRSAAQKEAEEDGGTGGGGSH